ncbi:MAG: putative rane protein [Labilithrix sp.]|nr:putative rane protein [Labilithrix sp.]
MTASRSSIVAFVVAALAASSVQAAPPARPAPAPLSDEPRSLSDILTGDAKTQYDLARILYRDGDYASAVAKFRRSYEISKDVRLLWNMAACEKNLRHYVKVLGLIERYVRDGQLDAPDLERALTFATAVRSLVGEVALRADEAGATVAVDEEPVGETPFDKPLLVDMGRHKIRLAKAGFRPLERTIDVEGGVKQELAVALEREVGRVVVRARSGDSIRVDDKLVGEGTWAGVLPVGPHAVVVSRSSKTRRADIVLADRETRELTLETESGVPAWVWWVGGGVLVAGAAVGGYFLFRPSRDEAPTGTIGAYQVP